MMRKGYRGVFIVLALAMLLTAGAARTARSEEAGETAEWTVMFYFCGSDLESRNSYATGNLEEIAACYPYAAMRNYMRKDELETPDTTPAGVNVVVETGGCRKWHAQELGMEIATDRLQRWHYEPRNEVSLEEKNRFTLREERPLASMADPETLADFIRWSAENYPAKKYALVLWGHGLGSQTGMLVDELFDRDTLYLDELRTALAEGGITLETMLFDACLMANLETAYMIRDYAKWMVASEELVSGKGTAVEEWLQRLYYSPEWDGRRLGKTICEMNQMKFANEEDDQAIETMTWSVIDLSKIDRLAELTERLFEQFGKCYETNPIRTDELLSLFDDTWEFGVEEGFHMLDLGSSFDQTMAAVMLDRELRQGILDALAETVVYNVRDAGRYSASGLSFCDAVQLDPQDLDTYARNCPFAGYLALLDAVTPGWNAPEWVYEKTERLRDIQEFKEYQIRAERIVNGKGVPGLGFSLSGQILSLGNVYVELYWQNPDTGNIVRMGSQRADFDFDLDTDQCTFTLKDFGTWPAVEGVPCDLELYWDGDSYREYMIPIQMGMDIRRIRCGYDILKDEKIAVTGLWEGFDVETSVSSRSALSLSQVAGQEFFLLYPIDGSEETGETRYESGPPMTMYRALEISNQTLPAGMYYLEYRVEDLFRRQLDAGRVEVYWDGEKATLPDPESWQGTELLLMK